MEAPFPDGEWKGFFLDPRCCDGRHGMDLSLTFREGRLHGAGIDKVGKFALQGRYDGQTLEVRWTKHYIGAHDVYYRGFGEKGWIWGTWTLDGGASGGFKIWPGGHGAGEAESTHVEEEVPDAITAPAPVPGGAPPATGPETGF